MKRRLVFENSHGQVQRVFSDWSGESAVLVQRFDNRRLELHSDLDRLKDEDVDFIEVKRFKRSELEKSPIELPHLGRLRFVDTIANTVVNVEQKEEKSKDWLTSLGAVSFLVLAFVAFVLNVPRTTPDLEEELKQHVVKIMKRSPKPRVKITSANISRTESKKAQSKPKSKKLNVRRVGALAVLGRLNKSRQRGGLNLGALKTSRGPGLGGSQGSGGVQKSLYGKGIVAAPVGAGGNIQGAGGYGTKGKGGGQDGYGTLSLVGSAGSNPIPLGSEAIIAGGLDRDLIAEVIRRNMGQIRFCYEQGLQSDPKLRGRVAVDFTIGGNGRVKTAGVKNTTLHSKMVENCIVLRLRSWKFPLPEGGVEVKVSYPFLLRRVGQS